MSDKKMDHDKKMWEFRMGWSGMAADIHKTCRDKGFWVDRDNVRMTGRPVAGGRPKQFAINESLMLIVTEIAEACEAVRNGNPPDDKVPQFSGLEAELADAVIRIMDLAAGYDLDVAGAIIAKAEFNKTREHLHGKKC